MAKTMKKPKKGGKATVVPYGAPGGKNPFAGAMAAATSTKKKGK